MREAIAWKHARELEVALRAAAPSGQPVAWSPVSKTGLLRGVHYGQPTDEDLAIAESDGDTIRYFYDPQPSSDARAQAVLLGISNLLRRCLRHGLLRSEIEVMLLDIDAAMPQSKEGP
jgi:hypothetical protein